MNFLVNQNLCIWLAILKITYLNKLKMFKSLTNICLLKVKWLKNRKNRRKLLKNRKNRSMLRKIGKNRKK